MIEKLQRRFALSRKGAMDVIKGSLFSALQNISFMLFGERDNTLFPMQQLSMYQIQRFYQALAKVWTEFY